MEYTIVEGFDPEQVGKDVDALLSQGWELYGSLQLAAYHAPGEKTQGDKHRIVYAQAMIKRTPKAGKATKGKK